MRFLSICWFYIGPVLFIALPSVAGMMLHHFRWRRVSKALDWLFWVFIILVLVIIWVLSQALVYVLYSPSTLLLSLCGWIMLIQSVFWCYSWLKNRGKGELSGWKAVSLPAFIISLIIACLTFTTYFKKKDLQHLDILKHRHQARVVQEQLKDVGYIAYPDATYPFSKSTMMGSSDSENYLSFHMRTDDDPDKVLAFYRECVSGKGFEIYRYPNKSIELTRMVAFDDDAIFEIRKWSNELWVITIRWAISGDIADILDEINDFSEVRP